MNIIMITSEPPYPSNSGGRIYTWERIKILSESNNIYLYSIDDIEKDQEHILKYCKKVNFYGRNKNLVKSVINISKPYTAFSRYSSKMKENIKSDIKTYDIDLIILDMPQLYYNLPQNNEIPVVLTQHNIEYKTFFNISKNSKNIFKKLVFFFEGIKLKIFEKNFLKEKCVDMCTFISEDDKNFFEINFPKMKSVLIPFGYEFVNKDYLKMKKNRIVFTGKMDYQPNIDAVKYFTSNIFNIIEKNVENVEFYIVGKNPTREVLELKRNNIIVTGAVDNVEKYIDESELIVIPLLSGGGVKIKLLQALGRENIVVTTDKGIEGTMFKNGEHVLVENTSNEFALRCIDVLNNRNKYEYLVANSKNLITREYSWKSIGEKYNNILSELIM
ncbi:glycosyltransferase [Clostridium perfringens]